MNKSFKKTVSLFLSLILIISTLGAIDLSSVAATKWTPIASSDFSAISSAVSNGSLGEVPTYKNQGNPISWSTAVWTNNGNAVKESDALYIPDGYLYMSGYNANSNSGIPIKNCTTFKVDFEFSYKDVTIDGAYSSNGVSSDGSYTFMKIGAYGDVLSDYNAGMFGYSTFTQDANGKTFSYDTTITDGASGRRVASSGDNISAGVVYHYVVEYTGNYARAYVTDSKGTVVQEEFNTSDAAILNEFAKGLPNANYMKMGCSSGGPYLRALEYRNIVFYTADTNFTDPSPSSDEDKYLFAYFTGNSTDGEKLRYAVSDDGVNFAPLNKGVPVWNPDNFNADDIEVYPSNSGNIGITKHIRDPYAFKGQNGKYYILATDLSTPQHGFNNNSKLLVWELESLADIDETTPWSIDAWDWFADMCGGYVNRSWAPQAIWDPVQEMYMMYWAIGYVEGKTVMYYMYTPDFKTFVGEPKRLVNYGNADNIDGDITYSPSEKLYYLWYKNENTSTLGYATSPACCGPYTNTQSVQANDGLEGCQVYQRTDGSYILLADAYGAGYFKVYPSDTLSGFNDSNILDSDINYLSPRHGSVLRITTAEYNSLVNKFGVRQSTSSLEYYFSEGRDWGNTNYTKDIKDASGETYTLGATGGYKTTSGTLELDNGNLFIESDKARNIIKGSAFTLTFKHKLTESYKYTEYYNMITVGNYEQDFIALAEDGTFYVNGKACPNKANTAYNVESEYTVCFNGSTVSLLQNGEYVTGALFNNTISEAANGSLYVGLGWSDKTSGGRTTGTYRDFVLSPTATLSGHEGDYLDEYLAQYDYDEINTPAEFKAFAYHYSHVATNGYSNVVYSPQNTTVMDGNGTENDSYVNIGRMNFKIGTPRTMVLVYDGAHEVSYPVVLEQIRQQSSGDTQLIHYVGSNASVFSLQNDWLGYSQTYNLWPASNIVSRDTIAYWDNNNYDESNNLNNAEYHFYSNKMIYNGSGDTDKYYEVVNNDSYYVKNSYKESTWGASRQYKYGDITSFCTRYVINYAPVYKMLSGETKVPGTDKGIVEYYNSVVKGNESKFTPSSLRQFYTVMAAISDSNPNNYSYNATQTDVVSCAANIKKAVSEFTKINMVEKADFSELDAQYDNADELLKELEGSAVKYTKSSINAVINAVDSADNLRLIDSSAREEAAKSEYQSEIDAKAQAIRNAVASIDDIKEDASDFEVYQEVVAIAENPDSDIYSCSKADSLQVVSTLSSMLAEDTVEYVDINGNKSEILTLDENSDQDTVDGISGYILSYLASNIKSYDISIEGDAYVSFTNNGTNVQKSEKLYSATYNSTAVFETDTEDTAWYMEYASTNATRTKQYQGTGDRYKTQVIGDMTVYAQTRSAAAPNKVTVVRDYQNDVYTVQLITFVDNSFTLPAAPAKLGYDFIGYYIGENAVSGTIDNIDSDITVIAKYQPQTSHGYSVIVKSTDGSVLYSKEADEYNNRVSVSDSAAYGWVEKISKTDNYRPFFIGSELTFYVSESTEIKAVTKAEFDAFGFELPAINTRQSRIETSSTETGTKGHFNGQTVNDPSGEAVILEYGYLIGVSKNRVPGEKELVLKNAGENEDYRIIRAKSTKNVGANQFSIGVNRLSNEFAYRGYIIYQIGGGNGEIKTVYTDYMT